MFEQRTEAKDRANQMNVCKDNQAEGTASAKTQRRDHICHVQDHVAGRTAWQKQCGRVTGIGQRGQGTQVPQGMWGFGSFFARRWGATGGLGAEE